MTPAIAKVLVYQDYARRATALAALVCMLSIVCYGVFLLVAVEKVAAQQNYRSEAHSISATLATLESQYLVQSAQLTPQKAAALGLVPVPTNGVAYQQTGAPRFSLR